MYQRRHKRRSHIVGGGATNLARPATPSTEMKMIYLLLNLYQRLYFNASF